MKFNTFDKYPYLAEYWGWTTDPADINAVKTWAFTRNVPVRLNADGSGRLFLYTKDAYMLLAGQIRKVTLAVNSAVVIEGLYNINVQEPVFNSLDPTDFTYKYWMVKA